MQVFPVTAALVALSLVACSGSSTTGGTGIGTASGAGAQQQRTAGGGATCDSACAHYLGCKGADDTSSRAACNADCATRGYTEQAMSDFLQTDCVTAVCEIENTCGGTSSSGGTSSGGPAAGGDCTDCAWDGSSCIWLSPSTGLSSACGGGNACCPGH